MAKIKDMKIKLFLDGANLKDMQNAVDNNKLIKGFTTNPTLMAKAGIKDYKKFALEALKIVQDLPLCFEVFSDDIDGMYRQAKIIDSWAKNAWIKIPITNTKGEPSYDLIRKLSYENIKLNITAILPIEQVQKVKECLNPEVEAIVSVFAGRIADTGRDPIAHMKTCLEILAPLKKAYLLWASPREVLNFYQANDVGCHIITMTQNLIDRLSLADKNLDEFSLETVKMFYDDSQKSGFAL
ncbi:MAG: transaldolase [Elusimicrobiota bacterium]|jgi:transaldolase|nr:transaldolase [Elusimicrobiota bacterium]